jgi:hypothetical protein
MSELQSSMNQVEVEQKSYQMPPQDGFQRCRAAGNAIITSFEPAAAGR